MGISSNFYPQKESDDGLNFLGKVFLSTSSAIFVHHSSYIFIIAHIFSSNLICFHQSSYIFIKAHIFSSYLTSSCVCALTVSRLWGRERTSGHSKIITNILFSPKSKNSPICIVSPPPPSNNICDRLFSIVHPRIVFYGLVSS